MAKFELAYRITEQAEGGYVNDPDDRGAETYKGIARKFFPSWSGWPIIEQYKSKLGGMIRTGTIFKDSRLNDLVKEFFQNHFWHGIIKGDLIKDQNVANLIFDFSVNSAGGRKVVQKVLNKLGAKLEVDGIIGPQTLGAINSYPDQEKLHDSIKQARIAYLKKGASEGWIHSKFLDGLIKRVELYFPDLKKKDS